MRIRSQTRASLTATMVGSSEMVSPLMPNDPYNVALQEAETNGELPPPKSPRGSKRRRQVANPLEHIQDLVLSNGMPFTNALTCKAPAQTQHELDASEKHSTTIVFLQSHPTMQELADIIAATKTGFALTGSAALGNVGPVIGQMAIGECEDSYLFRVSLPGVKRDEREFSCEVDNDGKVSLRGVTTTGEKRVSPILKCLKCNHRTFAHQDISQSDFSFPGQLTLSNFPVVLALMDSRGNCDEKDQLIDI